jgi:7-cyano-7-deazaguanine synthase
MSTPVVILSGGLDSTVLAYAMQWWHGVPPRLVSFDYGQRHRIELDCARRTAQRLHATHTVVDLRSLTTVLSGSALTDDAVAVPDGHYAEDTMRATIVPNRNMIFLSVAAGLAAAEGHREVLTAVHAGDHYIYPDCRVPFIDAVDAAVRLATEGVGDVRILAPYASLTKAQVVAEGDELGVSWKDTWSCYKGGAIHCGACGTCFERREAFALAGVPDPTAYVATPEYAHPEVISCE